MAEGIMGLAPGMGAPAAPQQAPQAVDPRNLQVFMDASASMDPAEFEGQLDEAIGEIDPALAQQLQAELSAIQLPPEMIEVLLDVVNGLLEAPEEYAQRRMEVIEAGLPADFLPEEFNVEYLSTLRYVLMRLPAQAAAPEVQGFKNGGAVSLKPVAKFLQSQGRNGDTILAHINRSEAAMLKRMGGSGTINPVTGLREYFFKKAWKAVTKTVKKVGKAIAKVVKPVINVTKKLLSNPIVRTVATVAAVAFSGGTASAVLGAGAGKTAAGMALGSTINTTAVSLLAGEKPKDALKQGLMTGFATGVGSYAAGMPLTQTRPEITLTNPFTGTESGLRSTIGKGFDAINPFSSGTPSVTADTKFDELVAKGLPRDANTYKLATEAADKANKFTFLGMDTPTAIMTLGPPALSLLAPDEQPTPEDLNMPGVGGPTGMELLEGDPGKYGVTIGETSSTYTDPYAGIEDRTPISIGGVAPPASESSPGTMPPIGSESSAGFAPVSPTMPTGDQYANMFSGYDPTKDPMNPMYNPFAGTSTPSTPFTGGIDVAQGFAKGGIATLAKGGSAKKPSARLQAQKAGEERKRIERGYGSVQNYQARMGTLPTQKSAAELQREAQASAMSKQRLERRTAAEQQKRVGAIVTAAQKAAQEGRSFDFGPGYANEQDLYRQAIQSARTSDPTKFMTPNEAEAYVAQQRNANLVREKAAFEQSQAQAIALAKRNEEALAAKQKAEQELADFEAYKASILGPGGSTQPITTGGGGTLPVAPPANITLGGGGNPTGDMSNTGLPKPSAPVAPEIIIGAVAPAPVAPATNLGAVYGPDGTQYGSPAAAITAGVFNYSMTPPAEGGIGSLALPAMSVPSVNFGSAPAISPTNVPSAFGTGSTAGFGSGSTAGAFGSGSTANAFGTQPQTQSFAAGGIAAMAPYKFKSGSKPVQHFPRRTGPINGPGTGTSDSIPAMLSDGEFVFTAKAVRGMGNGSRLAGAKKMYKMMKMLEGKS